MRRFFTTTLVLIGFLAFSQKEDKVIAGLRGGINISNFSANWEDMDKLKPAMGAYISYWYKEDFNKISEDLVLHGELTLEQNVARNTATEEETKYKSTSFYLGVIPQYKLRNNLSLGLGGYVGVDSNLIDKGAFSYRGILVKGIILGVEYNLNDRFFIDTRYKFGLGKSEHLKDRAFLMGIGFKFYKFWK